MALKNTGITRMLILILGDILIAISAFYAGVYIRFGELHEGLLKHQPVFLRIALFVIVFLLCSFFTEMYEKEKNSSKKEILLRSFLTGMISLIVLSAFYYILPFIKVWRGSFFISIAVFTVLQGLWHITYRLFIRLPGFAKRVLILGTGPKALQIGNLIATTNHKYIFSGYMSCHTESLIVPSYHLVNNGSNITEIARNENIHKIVVSLSERRGVLPLKDMMNCKLSGIDITDAPSFYEEVAGKLFLEDIKPSSLIFSDGFKTTSISKFSKRVIDIVLTLIGIIITAPLMPIIALLIKIDTSGPVLFRQLRVGEREKNFVLYKFRTMYQDAENEIGAVWAQKNDARVTSVGKILRKTRLDEIPQLFNVLKGDMSLIGPRPERPEFVEKLKEKIPYYSERHFVKPGISGWAQVKYRYGASVEDAVEKLRYDLYYIKNLSFFLDMLIVLETVKVVLFGRGSR
jgi:sugar transferase (PEP-CTERM system associated)